MSVSIDNEINRGFCEEILETLNQMEKVNCHGNGTCLSLPKEDQTGIILTSLSCFRFWNRGSSFFFM